MLGHVASHESVTPTHPTPAHPSPAQPSMSGLQLVPLGIPHPSSLCLSPLFSDMKQHFSLNSQFCNTHSLAAESVQDVLSLETRQSRWWLRRVLAHGFPKLGAVLVVGWREVLPDSWILQRQKEGAEEKKRERRADRGRVGRRECCVAEH